MTDTRRGFTLYLTFLVTTVLLLLSLASQDLSRFGLDLGRSAVLGTTAFHAADGGLERGLARLSRDFRPFELTYSHRLQGTRLVEVRVTARQQGSTCDLRSEAAVREGNRVVAVRCLERLGVRSLPGRAGCGRFLEAS